ncbi:MAG: HAD family phosphatase [Rikenellaceae bacterium]|nr:HAD family phosphatase [Rikenellaceae bacterium]
MAKVKNLLFDLGGVLVDLWLDKCLKAFHELGFAGIDDELLNPYHTDGMFGDSELGLVSEAELRDYVRRQAGNPDITDKQIDDAYYEFIGEIPEYKLQMLAELKQKYNIYMLSNTSSFVYPRIARQEFTKLGATVEDYFDGIYLSYEMHLAKPDPKVFEHILKDAGIKAEETLFFDDSQVNLDAAAALGFQTYLVDVQEDFRHVFEEMDK